MDETLLKDRIFDTADIAEKNNKPKFFGFLSPEQAVFADRCLSHRNVKYSFFGGYGNANRVMLGCFPEWAEETDYPIEAITATYRKTDILTHRDFLGCLMSLGLKRETVGDIVLEPSRAVIFVTKETVEYILNQVTKIGRVGVTLKRGFEFPLPEAGQLKDFTGTISSERLDCVVSVLAGISRGKAVEKIEQSTVSINSVVTDKITRQVTEGDIITIRGYGKFIIDSTEDKTRKQRIVLKYKKYI